MVTKQQQLEWLAKEFCIWPSFGGVPIRMSSVTIGVVNNGLGVAHHIRMDEWQQERDRIAEMNAMTMQMCNIAPQERDKMSSKPEVDNSWHERGELPPVGCTCEVKEGGEWHKTHIVGFDDDGYCVYTTPWNCTVRDYEGDADQSNFRPLRTEREKAIDEMVSIIKGAAFQDPEFTAEILYDAGYRKVKP